MKILTRQRLWTDEELMALPDDGRKRELCYGKVVTMAPAGFEHGDAIARLIVVMGAFAYERKLGRVYDGQTGYRLSLEHCFAPDVSFVSRQRRRVIAPPGRKLFQGAPDLAVEVLSPSDSITGTEQKITLYLVYGTRVAWMVDLKHQRVRVYREIERFEVLRPGQHLTGNSALPGFRYPVARLFEDQDFA